LNQPPDRHALIVAVSNYRDAKLRALRAPGADARRLATVLGDPAIGGFDVAVAENEEQPQLARRIARFFANRRADDLLLLHFSCHGIKDERGELYLAATDTEVDLLTPRRCPRAGSTSRSAAAEPAGAWCCSTAASAGRFRSVRECVPVARSTSAPTSRVAGARS
jgi:hypothetical protein